MAEAFHQTRVDEPSRDANAGKGATGTVAIECDECPDGYMLINRSDFNPKEHAEFKGEVAGEPVDPVPAPAPRKRRAKAETE